MFKSGTDLCIKWDLAIDFKNQRDKQRGEGNLLLTSHPHFFILEGIKPYGREVCGILQSAICLHYS